MSLWPRHGVLPVSREQTKDEPSLCLLKGSLNYPDPTQWLFSESELCVSISGGFSLASSQNGPLSKANL